MRRDQDSSTVKKNGFRCVIHSISTYPGIHPPQINAQNPEHGRRLSMANACWNVFLGTWAGITASFGSSDSIRLNQDSSNNRWDQLLTGSNYPVMIDKAYFILDVQKKWGLLVGCCQTNGHTYLVVLAQPTGIFCADQWYQLLQTMNSSTTESRINVLGIMSFWALISLIKTVPYKNYHFNQTEK